VSVFADASHLGLLVTISGIAVISGTVMTRSIQEEDAVAAWIWVMVFGATSVVAAWSFWTLV
jgi:hypothetical protein